MNFKLYASILVLYLATIALPCFGQIQFGIKAGISSFDFDPDDLFVEGQSVGNNFSIAFDDATFGTNFGVFMKTNIGFLLLQPELMVHSVKVDYELKDFSFQNIDDILSERYTNLDVPLLVGLDLGVLELKGGPVGHLHLSSNSELVNIETYTENFDNLTWGWQAGLGIQVWKFLFDVRYERNNDDFANHFVFEGQPFAFDQRSTRYIGTLGFIF